MDGTNIRVHWNGAHQVHFGGRTDKAQIPPFLLTRLEDLFWVEEIWRQAFDAGTWVTLYGEGYGAKIQQGGGYIPDGVDFILFDVLVGFGDNALWLRREDVFDIADKLDIQATPIVGSGTLEDAVSFAKQARGSPVAQDPSKQSEGIVLRPKVELLDRFGKRIITKLKYRDFNSEH